ncbi:diguanylate cyclase (GGDEF)-like protein [Stackebrandtia endophytica]|uniref:Diguanylate cyclase (GGDEF)-like protein n=1 Tax=Stackebrandtia endophytica TaxID=1496996 RepID=A0A543AW99_9ACTN|nr:GGDEF domain-containing protein [Stackebrandtia endophytica]TQL76820.1 diguanylate cyclase (GGDEF)-like protein [Stackebrandtia endophytica]
MSLEYFIGAASGAAPAIAATAVITSGVIRRRAAIDPLTGIPSRAGLPVLERLVRRGLRRGEHTAVVVLDLRGFKQVNDTHGHDAGDMVIRAVAQRLAACDQVRGVVRLGGDEFAAVVTSPTGVSWKALLTAINVALASTGVRVSESATVYPSATIGAAIAQPGDTLTELLSGADYAMYRARLLDDDVNVKDGGIRVYPRDGIRPRDVRPARPEVVHQ